ncbi:MAG: hypothetical protein O7D86_03640 [Proteobacteria bacterium]|nr:hypothetical protein [Pseudomonadota bacterium]
MTNIDENQAKSVKDGLTTVKRQSTAAKMTKANNKDNFDEAAQAAFKKEIHAKFEQQGDPYYATARLWDDGIINPITTRSVLGMAIPASRHAPVKKTSYGVFRM